MAKERFQGDELLISLPMYGSESIVFGTNFHEKNFDGITHFEAP